MSTMTRDELADRLAVLKREDWPRFSLDHLRRGEDTDALRRILGAAERSEHVDLVNAYLRAFVPGDCPGCGHGWFGWGIGHGAGSCSCGWPGRLLHYIHDTRDLPEIICTATCNGHRVCDRPRGEHERVVAGYSVESHEPHYELRCPDPKPVPGLSRAATFPAEYRAPEIVSFSALLWVHPYEVHLRPKTGED